MSAIASEGKPTDVPRKDRTCLIVGIVLGLLCLLAFLLVLIIVVLSAVLLYCLCGRHSPQRLELLAARVSTAARRVGLTRRAFDYRMSRAKDETEGDGGEATA